MGKRLEYIIDMRDGSFGRNADKAHRQISTLDGAVSRLRNTIGIGIALEGGRRLLQFADRATEAKMVVQSLDNAILFSNSKEGARNLQFLEKTSEKLGNNLLAAKEGFALLSAGAIGTKISNTEVKNIFEATTTALTVMGRSTEDQKLALLALSQMMGKGKVQAEELRGQLGERIPGATAIMARALNVSQAELNKLLEQGKLLSEEVLPLFAKELMRTFSPGVNKAISSTRAEMGRLQNQTDITMANLGSQLEGVSKDWKQLKLNALDFVSSILPKIDNAKPLYAITAELNKEFETLQKLNPKSNEAKTLREKMNATYPQYLRNLLTEKSTLQDIFTAQNLANSALAARYTQVVGDQKVGELEKDKNNFQTKLAELERRKAEIEGRQMLGDEPGFFESSFKNQKIEIANYERLYTGALERVTQEIEKEKTLTFKLRWDKDRAGLINDAANISELGKALGRQLPDNLSATGLGDLIDLANQKYGSNLSYDKFNLRQGKNGFEFFNSEETKDPADKFNADFKSNLSAGRSVRNVTVNIENLVRQLTVQAKNTTEGMGKIKNDVTDALLRSVADFEMAQ